MVLTFGFNYTLKFEEKDEKKRITFFLKWILEVFHLGFPFGAEASGTF